MSTPDALYAEPDAMILAVAVHVEQPTPLSCLAACAQMLLGWRQDPQGVAAAAELAAKGELLTVSAVCGRLQPCRRDAPDPNDMLEVVLTAVRQGLPVLALVARPPYLHATGIAPSGVHSRWGQLASSAGPRFELPHHAVVVAGVDEVGRALLLPDPWYPASAQPVRLLWAGVASVLPGDIVIVDTIARA